MNEGLSYSSFVHLLSKRFLSFLPPAPLCFLFLHLSASLFLLIALYLRPLFVGPVGGGPGLLE